MSHLSYLKKAIYLGLTAALLLPLGACGNAADTTETTASTTTETATATEATATQTELPAGWTPASWVAEPEEMLAATKSVPVIKQSFGTWVTPRAHLMTTQEDADARYAELAESGINMIYSFDQMGDPALLDRALRAAEQAGVSVMVDLHRVVDESTIAVNLEIVRSTKDYPAVLGYNMYDEPNAAVFDLMGQELVAIREIVGQDKLIMCNLFPNYATDAQLGTVATADKTAYQNYIEGFMNKVGPDVLSFDYYPFTRLMDKDSDKIKGMFKNFSDIALYGKQYDVPTWGFVQNSSWSGTRIPNDGELRFLSHFHLMFGLESYSYFLYAQPSPAEGVEGIFQGMLTYDGERTDIYDRVKANNEALRGLRGRYLDYELVGFLTDELSRGYAASLADELKLESFGPLTAADTDRNLLIGCFENDKGEKAYYALNMVYAYDASVTLEFRESTAFSLWGSQGIEQMGSLQAVTFDLLPGEGKFIEMKTYPVHE